MLNQKLTKNIISQLLIISMIALVGCPSKPSEKATKDDNTPKNFYEITEETIKINDALGTKLPKAATIVAGDLSFYGALGGATRDFWLIVEMNKLDFEQIVQSLEMHNEPTLLSIYPDTFECKSDKVSADWNLTKEIDENSFFCELPNYEGYRFAKYENSKLYFKKVEIYDDLKNDQNEIVYIKRVKN